MKNKDLWIISWWDRPGTSKGVSLFFRLLSIAYIDGKYAKTGVYFHAGQNLAVIYKLGEGAINIWIDSKMLLAIVCAVLITYFIL